MNGGRSVDEKANGTDVCAVDMFGFALSLHLEGGIVRVVW